MHETQAVEFFAFPTKLGWMAIMGRNGKVLQLVFGHTSRAKAIGAIDKSLLFEGAAQANWCPTLVKQLQAYAAGLPVDLSRVEVSLDHLTGFARRVIERCRRIGYAKTQSYGELAKASGSARAARAVGNAMKTNRLPLLVPCHRVIHSSGRPGGFSSPAGPCMKERLLDMERAAIERGR